MSFQRQLALRGVVDGLDELADAGEVAVAAGFIAPVGTDEAHVQLGGLDLEAVSGEALVADEHNHLGQQVVVAGVAE